MNHYVAQLQYGYGRSVEWSRRRIRLWQHVLVITLLACFAQQALAYHEASEPSDGTVKSFKTVNPPRTISDIPFISSEGNEVSFSKFRGKVVLLNLWASWCPPCIRELPALDRLQAKVSQDDFVIIPIAVEQEGFVTAAPVYTKLKIRNLGLYTDPKQRLKESFPLDVFPATFILNRKGEMISYLRSFVDWDAPEAEVMIRHLLSQ